MKRWMLFGVVAATLLQWLAAGPDMWGFMRGRRLLRFVWRVTVRLRGRGMCGSTGIGVFAATITRGLAGVGNGLRAGGIVGKRGGGSIAATAINGATGAGVKTLKTD